MTLTLAAAPRRARQEPGRAFRHPKNELGKPWMFFQSLNTGIVARQFGLRQRGVNLVVANLMQQHGRATLATFELGHEVVQALMNVRRYRPVAKRANRFTLVRHDLPDSAEIPLA